MRIIYKIYNRILRLKMLALSKVLNRIIILNYTGTVKFIGTPLINIYPDSKISIGDRCVLCSDSRFTDLGINHRVVIRTLSSTAKITIGDDVGISGGSICALTEVKIGDRVLIGANVTICDTDFHVVETIKRRYVPISLSKSRPVSIGSDVFIGANSIILKGVSIGDGAVIGAGSVVTKNIPSNSISAGNPCVVLRTIGQSGDV